MHRLDRRMAVAIVSLGVVAVGVRVAEAQFAPPTCLPPNCNPTVIQNIDTVTGAAQNADINITGDAKLGATFQAGAAAPTLTLSTENLLYGNVSGSSANASLLLLQFGLADRLRVSLAGQMQLPLGSAAAPSYTFLGDTNTGFFSPAADQVAMAVNGTSRLTVATASTTVASTQLLIPSGTAATPGLAFSGDTNAGIFRSAADTMHFVTNGTTAMTISSTSSVIVPNAMQVNGPLTSTGGISGDGSSLTNINASNITSGTLNDARLSSNVALENLANVFSSPNAFLVPTTFGTINTALGAGQDLIYGIVDATSVGNILRLRTEDSGTYVDRFVVSSTGNVTASGSVTASSFVGSGAGLTSLNASNITSGTLSDARLSTNVPLLNANNVFTGNNTFSGMTTLGGESLVLAGGQNMLYGVVDNTSTGNLLLLQSESGGVYTDEFKVAANGDTTINGNATISGTLTVGGQGVVTGSGTVDYVPKFTGASTLGNSVIVSDSAGRVGIGEPTPAALLTVGFGDLFQVSTTGNVLATSNPGSADAFTVDVNNLTTGRGLYVIHDQASATRTTGSLVYINDNPSYSTTQSFTGHTLYLSRQPVVTAGTVTVNNPAVFILDGGTQSGGTLTHTGSVMQVRQNYTGSSGTVMNIANYGTGAIFRANPSGSFTDSNAFVIDNSGNVGIRNGGPGFDAYLHVGVDDLYVRSFGVGIGTTTVTADLTVGGTGLWNGIQITNTSASDYDPVLFFSLSGTDKFTMGVDDSTADDDFFLALGSPIARTDVLYVNGSTGYMTAQRRFQAQHGGNQGLKLPTAGGVPAAVTGTAEGDIVWNTVGDTLYVYDGAAFRAIGTLSGSGTANTLPKFTAATTLGNSLVTDNGTTVTAGGAFSVTGSTTLGDAGADAVTINASTASVPNNLNFDANTLYIDATNNRVGVGTAAPTTSLHVAGAGTVTGTLGVNGAVPAAGTGLASTGTFAGVYGTSSSAGATGVYGDSVGAGGIGVYGTGASYGVYGSSANIGVYGYSTNIAAQFDGVTRVVGKFLATDAGSAAGTAQLNVARGAGFDSTIAGEEDNYPVRVSTTVENAGALFEEATNDEFVSILADATTAGIKFSDTVNRFSIAKAPYGNRTAAGIPGTGGTELLTILANGQVGIGTTSPQAAFKLTINDDGSNNGIALMGDGVGDLRLRFDNTTAIDGYLFMDQDQANAFTMEGPSLQFNTNGANTRMTIDSSGNVGIGTTAPGTKLDVAGNLRASGPIFSTDPGGYAQTELYQWGLYSPGAMYIEPGAGSTLYLTDSWSSTGVLNVQFGQTYFQTGTVRIANGLGTGGELPSSGYGIRSEGTTMGGYFQDADQTSTYAYIGYFTYGGYFNSSYNSVGTGWNNIAVYAYAANANADGDGGVNYGLWVAGGTARVSCASLWVDRGSYIDCADIAEVYDAGEKLEPGDVVVWKEDGGKKLYKSRRPYEEALAGVYSTSPGVLMGNQDDKGTYGVEIGNDNTRQIIKRMQESDQMPLALAGRAPVKVTLENGAIKPGDLLTSSSRPGYAMKAKDTGRVLGIAMESFDGSSGSDQILAFINAHHWVNPDDYAELKAGIETLKGEIEALKRK